MATPTRDGWGDPVYSNRTNSFQLEKHCQITVKLLPKLYYIYFESHNASTERTRHNIHFLCGRLTGIGTFTRKRCPISFRAMVDML